MKALIFNRTLHYVRDYPVPHVNDDEALVRILLAGICATDLEITKGYMAFQGVPGHEFTGIVEQSSKKNILGKRVVGEINIECGTCHLCRSGLKNHCPERSVLGILNRDGVFAEYVALPISNLHIIPKSISDQEAVFVEPLAAAYEILEQIQIRPSDRVCVLGDGKLGLLVAQVLSMTKCNLLVAGKYRVKLSLLDDLGIRTAFVSSLGEKLFDVVIECTGSRTGIDTALRILKPRGTLVLKTTIAKRSSLHLSRFVIDEIHVLGSRCGPFAPAIEALRSGKIDVLSMISDTFKLKDGVKAFQKASKKGILKVMLDMN